MKCEKCAGELPDDKVICPQCGFNNALQNWAQRRAALRSQREPQTGEKAETTAKQSSPLAAKVRARYASEANLIHFPVAPKPAEETVAPEPPGEPDWRAQTKAKVRAHLERRKAEAEGGSGAPTASDDPTKQLLVESALKRIRRTPLPPSIPITRRGGAKSQALAHALDYEEQAYEEARLEAEPIHQPLNPPLAVLQSEPAPPPASARVPHALLLEPSTPAETSAQRASINLAAEIATPPAEPLLTESRPEAAPHEHVAEALPNRIELRADEAKKADLWVGKPAPLWLRTLAGAVDLEAALLAYLPFFAAYTSLDGPPEGADLYLMAAMLAVVVYLYQLITYSFNGRTFGMVICGLRCALLEDAARPISFKRRLWQSLGGTVALLCPPLNLLITRFTEYQRGLADLLTGTITLRRAQD